MYRFYSNQKKDNILTKEEIINEIKTILKDTHVSIERYSMILDNMVIVDMQLVAIATNETSIYCYIMLSGEYYDDIYITYEQLDLICLTRLLVLIEEELNK